MYVAKTNIPTIKDEYRKQSFSRKRDAMRTFTNMRRFCDNNEYAYKLSIRDPKTRRKPIRGTMQVEIGGFFFYVELYRE